MGEWGNGESGSWSVKGMAKYSIYFTIKMHPPSNPVWYWFDLFYSIYSLHFFRLRTLSQWPPTEIVIGPRDAPEYWFVKRLVRRYWITKKLSYVLELDLAKQFTAFQSCDSPSIGAAANHCTSSWSSRLLVLWFLCKGIYLFWYYSKCCFYQSVSPAR
jgi:hypothetical protein